MKILAVETSGMEASIALAVGDQLVTEQMLDTAGRRNARLLIPAVDELLKQASLAPAEIDVVAVSIGPGSFTGLRIGVVAAKTLAYSLGCEVKGIDTFLAVAHQSPTTIDAVTVIGDAQRGDLFVGDFERNDAAEWTPIGNIRIESAQLFENSLTGNEFLSGPGLTRYSSQLQNRERLLEDLKHHPSAAAICELSVREDIPLADYWSLEPLYLRKSSAEEKWDQKQSKSV